MATGVLGQVVLTQSLKQAQELIFSRKCTKEDQSLIYFNNIPVNHTTVQKLIRLYLDNIKKKIEA